MRFLEKNEVVKLARLDTYQEWERDNQLNRKLTKIRELRSKGYTMISVAEVLKLAPNTLTQLKSKYDDVKEALDKGNGKEYDELIGAYYRKARGFKVTIAERKYIYQTNDAGERIEILVEKKDKELYFPPDNEAIGRLLEINHGLYRNKIEQEPQTILEDNYTLELQKSIESIGEVNINATSQEE